MMPNGMLGGGGMQIPLEGVVAPASSSSAAFDPSTILNDSTSRPPESSKPAAREEAPSSKMTSKQVSKEDFELALAQQEIRDPVNLWLNYHKFAKANPQEGIDLKDLLDRAIRILGRTQRYNDDPKLLRLWIYAADQRPDPMSRLMFYETVAAKGIGLKQALLYEAWAAEHEKAGEVDAARATYELGLEREAVPEDRLKKRFAQFEERQGGQSRKPLNQLADSAAAIAEESEHNTSFSVGGRSSVARARPSLVIFDESKPKPKKRVQPPPIASLPQNKMPLQPRPVPVTSKGFACHDRFLGEDCEESFEEARAMAWYENRKKRNPPPTLPTSQPILQERFLEERVVETRAEPSLDTRVSHRVPEEKVAEERVAPAPAPPTTSKPLLTFSVKDTPLMTLTPPTPVVPTTCKSTKIPRELSNAFDMAADSVYKGFYNNDVSQASASASAQQISSQPLAPPAYEQQQQQPTSTSSNFGTDSNFDSGLGTTNPNNSSSIFGTSSSFNFGVFGSGIQNSNPMQSSLSSSTSQYPVPSDSDSNSCDRRATSGRRMTNGKVDLFEDTVAIMKRLNPVGEDVSYDVFQPGITRSGSNTRSDDDTTESVTVMNAPLRSALRDVNEFLHEDTVRIPSGPALHAPSRPSFLPAPPGGTGGSAMMGSVPTSLNGNLGPLGRRLSKLGTGRMTLSVVREEEDEPVGKENSTGGGGGFAIFDEHTTIGGSSSVPNVFGGGSRKRPLEPDSDTAFGRAPKEGKVSGFSILDEGTNIDALK